MEESQEWVPPPRERPVGSWSQFSASHFPPDDRPIDGDTAQRIKHFFRGGRHNALDGWETSTACYQTY